MINILTFILAGGKGERLNPLTRDRAKPSVPFGGIYRIIDFTLSNCINSGLRWIYVLTQYKSFSLQQHLLAGWNILSNELGEFIDIVPAQQRVSTDWYKGTADAIYQNIYAIRDHEPNMILILAGDHIYKMDYRKMIKFHIDMKSDMTVACVEMPKEESAHFGVVEVDQDNRVYGFQEKPKKPKTIPNNPSQIFASMGIYLFNKDVLFDVLQEDANLKKSEHDFGKNVIPQMIGSKKNVYVYNFLDNEGSPKYWRDIGTRDAYYQSNMDLVGPNPNFELFDRNWPVRTYHQQYPPNKITSGFIKGREHPASINNSLISGGCVISGAEIRGSVISPNVNIDSDAKIEDSVIMEGVRIGSEVKIKNAIIDKMVKVSSHTQIGYDFKKDQKRFSITTSGIVIVPKLTIIESSKERMQ